MGHVFFDESGKFADSDFVCIAGYIAGEPEWNAFGEKWSKLLLQHKIPYIHMKELMALDGPYKGWDHARRDDVLPEFLQVIREHIWTGFAVAVDSKYLRKMGADAKKKIGDPQIFCFQRLISLVMRKLQSVGYQPVISAVFDDSEEYSVKCYRVWSRLRVRVPPVQARIPAITFADDRVYNPLQAADILAWETNKGLRLRAANAEPRKEMETLQMAPEEGFALDYEGEAWGPVALDWLYAEIRAGRVPSLDDLAQPEQWLKTTRNQMSASEKKP